MNPQYPDDPAMNPFDLWNGANFKLRTRMVAGYLNYDQSTFEAPAALSDDDAELEKIWKSEYSLKEFVDPKNFKSYDELKKRLTEVLGDTTEVAAPAAKVATPSFDGPKARKSIEDTAPFDVDDDTEDYFKNLQEG